MFAAVPLLRGAMRAPGGVGLKRVLYRCFLDPYTNLRAQRFEATSIYGTRFEGTLSGLVQRRLFHFGVFEPNLSDWMWRTLSEGDVMVDVGANVGYFTLLAARAVGPRGAVVAVEAAPSTFAALEANVARNGAANVRTLNVAANDRDDTLPIYTIPGEEHAGGASLARAVGPQEAIVAARPLCDLLTADEIARVRVIKVDVEGAEAAVIRGLLPALDRMRPDVEIVVEVLPETKAAVEALFAQAGFHSRALPNPVDPLAPAEAAVEYLVFSRPASNAASS
jgi:FkbM family methyltransferase